MQITFVDRVALALPWAGGLVPATMTYHNAHTVLGFEQWQAILIGAVVEAIGFVTITTTLDLWELYQDGQAARMQSSDAPRISMGLFWVALAGTLVYLFVVVSVNALLDTGVVLVKVTKSLMASFGLLGGLMVALRNQMSKALAASAQAQARNDELTTTAKARQDEIERENREHAWQMEQERLRLEHEERMLKIEAESRRKLAKIESDGLRKASGAGADDSVQPPDDAGQSPVTRLRWSDVSADDYRWIVDAPVGEVVRKYKLAGKDPERLARTWKQYAKTALEKEAGNE